MQHALLPIEVCERIIDSCNSRPQFFHPRWHFANLCACALTCRDWVPRSRCNLYSSVRLRNPRQLGAFLDTIAAQPFLADFVQDLVVGGLTSPNKPSEKYLPFAQEAMVSALHGVRRLHICYYDWAAHHPRYHQLVARYPIVELSLLGGTYRTMADLFRVVWAFEHLQTLRLAIIEPFKQPGIPVDEIVKRHPQSCCNLHTVTIVGRALLGLQNFPPQGCFGICLTTLTLFWAQELGTMPSESLLLYLSAPNVLQHVGWLADCSHIWKQDHILYDCTSYVTRALGNVPADGPLRRVSLKFRAPINTGRISRTRFLECTLTAELQQALERFSPFEGFALTVPEPNRTQFGNAWWMRQCASTWRSNTVKMNVDTAPERTVWAEEADVLMDTS